jgi:TP901 family phage tail tape measure protein
MAKEINQKLGFDASGAINTLLRLQNGLGAANTSLINFGNTAKTFPAKAAPMVATLDRMATSATKLSRALNGLSSSTGKASLSASIFGKPQGFAENMKRLDEIAKKTKAAQQTASKTPTTTPVTPIPTPNPEPVEKVASAWQRVGDIVKGMVIHTAINAVVREFLGATEAARKFGLAIAEIQTIAGSLGKTNLELSNDVFELSNAMGKSAQDVAEGLYQTISNQVVDAADAFRFLAEAQKLAITTAATTEESVDALSSVMNSYSLGIEDTSRVSGQLFEIVNLGRLRLDEIADRIGRITPMAAQMGVSFAEVGGAIATMTVQGVKADTAITQLRAIMSKLQKPTEELKKVFRSWGVEDGPEALRTFGGLGGVLQKLSKETNNSSTEMAEFFNVVRSMTGYLALNTDEGNRFAEATKKIAGAGNAATTAYTKFLQTDAYSMTRQVNQLKNTFIQLGAAMVPIASFGANILNLMFGNVGKGTEVIVSWFDDFAMSRRKVDALVQAQAKRRELTERAFTRFERQEWSEREQVVREAVADMGASFNAYLKTIEASEKASTNVFKGFTEDIISNYESVYADLVDVSKNATDKIKKNNKSILDIESEISDLRFDTAFDKASTAFQKVDLLANRAGTQLNDALVKSVNGITDPDKFEEVMKGLERAEATARSALSEAGGDTRLRLRAENLVQTILEQQINLRRQYNEEVKKAGPIADAAAKSMRDKGEELKSLIEQYEAAMTREQKAETPAQKELERKTRESIKAQIDNIDFLPEVDIMKQLGMDPDSLLKLNFQLREVFNLKTIEWEGAQESINKALQEAKLTARVTLIPEVASMDFKGTGAAIGLSPDNYDNPASFDQAVFNEAKKVLADQDRLRKENKLSLDELQKSEFDYSEALRNTIMYLTKKRDAELANAKQAASSEGMFGRRQVDMEQYGPAKLKIETAMASHQTYFKQLEDFYKQLENGTALSEAQLMKLTEASMAYNAAGTDPAVLLKYNELLTKLHELNEQVEKRKVLEQEINTNTPKVPAATKFIENIEAMDQKLIDERAKVREVNQEVNAGAQGFDNQGTAVDLTIQKVNLLDATTSALLTPINSATSAYREMAMAASAAAESGAEALQYAYSGGSVNFLAAGGRGQDRRPAMLADGEFVVNSRSAGKFFSELNAMNSGSRPAYRAQGGAVTNVGDVNVTVKGGDTAQATVREIGQSLRREIQRGNIKLK